MVDSPRSPRRLGETARGALLMAAGALLGAAPPRRIRRAEAALTEQLRINRAITDNATAALFMLDPRGVCTFMNPAGEAMTGFALAEVRERRLHDLVHRHHPDGRPYPPEECPIVRAFHERAVLRRHEDVFVRRSGEPFPVVCSVSPIGPGASGSCLLEVRDLTPEKRFEREREMLLESERSARGEAERASRCKDAFVATISHELRAPLNVVLGWAQILRGAGQEPGQIGKGLEAIERNARRQIQLISDLLDVSRIVSGKIRFEPTPVDLVTTVDAVLDELRDAAAAKGVALSASLGPGLPCVLGDPARLAQVVSNLVSNAIKFTPSAGRVEVSLEPREASLELAVTDTGQGIPPEFVPCLFERFRQADASCSRQGGLGLGLSIVKHLVELHGGAVHAESEGLGQGARFVVELPACGAPRPHGEPVPAPRGPAAAASPWNGTKLHGVRVLVVDDEADDREIIQRILEEREAAVITAASAAQALAELARAPADVVVSDISMPGVDGYELMRRIRSGLPEPLCGVPALAITAFARDEDRARCLDAGFQLHLPKPVEAALVAAAVHRLATGAYPPEAPRVR